jgi:hypothetical protein
MILTKYITKIRESVMLDKSPHVDDATMENVIQQVTNAVQARLILEELNRNNIHSAEIYRLFAASQNSLEFCFLNDIVHTVIVYGNILPSVARLDLHPTTKAIFRALIPISALYNRRLEETTPSGFIGLGVHWASDTCVALQDFLIGAGNSHESNLDQLLNHIPPLAGKQPPTLMNQDDLVTFVSKSLSKTKLQGIAPTTPAADGKTMQERITKLAATFNEASGQQSQSEDMRTDLVEKALRFSAFQQGPMEGTPASGHEVSVDLGGDKPLTGEIYDRPLELSDDLTKLERLMGEARPLIQDIRKVLYPNTVLITERQKLCTSGSLDGSRLAMANFSSAIFKRYPVRSMTDRGGRPVLLIACDASGSLNSKQIKLLKILTMAWIGSTSKTQIQLISGIYHSGAVRKGLDTPLVQWIYHPAKTPALDPRDASRAIISLPESGTGIQYDSLSISYMVEEAASIAKGRMIYLILLSDCQWNKSFKTEKTGEQEVAAMFTYFNEKYENKLHTTLIGLGVQEKQPVFDKINKVILISQQEIDSTATVAQRISLYVANSIRERRLSK